MFTPERLTFATRFDGGLSGIAGEAAGGEDGDVVGAAGLLLPQATATSHHALATITT
jgi:hypothetical protein